MKGINRLTSDMLSMIKKGAENNPSGVTRRGVNRIGGDSLADKVLGSGKGKNKDKILSDFLKKHNISVLDSRRK